MYMSLRLRSSVAGGDFQARSRDWGTINVGVASARTETDDRKADVKCDGGKLSNRERLFRSVAVIFFIIIYFGAPPMARMPADDSDRGDLYSHTFTYSHIDITIGLGRAT